MNARMGIVAVGAVLAATLMGSGGHALQAAPVAGAVATGPGARLSTPPTVPLTTDTPIPSSTAQLLPTDTVTPSATSVITAVDTATISPTATATATPAPTPTHRVPKATPIPNAVFSVTAVRVERLGSRLRTRPSSKAVKRQQVGGTLRLSVYTHVTFAPAHPHWHIQITAYVGGKRALHRDLYPGQSRPVYNVNRVYHWRFTPARSGTYRITGTASAEGSTAHGKTTLNVTPRYLPTLHVSPTRVQAGTTVSLWVSSPYWPRGAMVSLSITSPHHSWKGKAAWKSSCLCFTVQVPLERAVHGAERATVTAQVVAGGRTTTLHRNFTIVGQPPPPPPTPTPVGGFGIWLEIEPKTPVSGEYPTITAHTAPYAVCSASMSYSGGIVPPEFSGFAQYVKPDGAVDWTWHLITKAKSGTATATCSYNGQVKSASLTFKIG